jgi:hydrogenase maturation protein HypF
VALEWNLAAEGSDGEGYPFELRPGPSCLEADLRPLVRGAALDLVDGVAPGTVSARFHAGLADVAVALVRAVADPGLPLVLTGGCFQNERLVSGVLRRLEGEREILRHGQVPPGDGGIALGQIVVADAVLCGRGELS